MELVSKTLHLSAASTAPNNNTVMLLHGFSNFCQEIVFTTHWSVKHKHWIRATLATLCFSKHKQELGTADCCTHMRNQELPPAWNTRQGRPSLLLPTSVEKTRTLSLCPGHTRDNVTSLLAVTVISGN